MQTIHHCIQFDTCSGGSCNGWEELCDHVLCISTSQAHRLLSKMIFFGHLFFSILIFCQHYFYFYDVWRHRHGHHHTCFQIIIFVKVIDDASLDTVVYGNKGSIKIALA